MEKFEMTDRYQAMGIPYPDVDTMCQGHCEGTGYIPINKDEEDFILKSLWEDAHAVSHTFKRRVKDAWGMLTMKQLPKLGSIAHIWTGRKCDGWHFIRCPDCKGTGRRGGEV